MLHKPQDQLTEPLENGEGERMETDSGQFLKDHELQEMIMSLCESKAEEFRMLGYEQVSAQEIWDCVNDKYAKQGRPPLHRLINDILTLKVTQFMNWSTMNVYKGLF